MPPILDNSFREVIESLIDIRAKAIFDEFLNVSEQIVGDTAGFTNHLITTTGNPHSVNKTDVGLGNVDNTSDLDKPVSALQQIYVAGSNSNVNLLLNGKFLNRRDWLIAGNVNKPDGYYFAGQWFVSHANPTDTFDFNFSRMSTSGTTIKDTVTITPNVVNSPAGSLYGIHQIIEDLSRFQPGTVVTLSFDIYINDTGSVPPTPVTVALEPWINGHAANKTISTSISTAALDVDTLHHISIPLTIPNWYPTFDFNSNTGSPTYSYFHSHDNSGLVTKILLPAGIQFTLADVKLEVGTVETPIIYDRVYDENKMKRYYESGHVLRRANGNTSGYPFSDCTVKFAVDKRIEPTITFLSEDLSIGSRLNTHREINIDSFAEDSLYDSAVIAGVRHRFHWAASAEFVY